MKRIIALSFLVFFLATGFNATAQMSKKEKKEWKKRAKALEPEQFKVLIEENKSLKSQTASLKNELAGVDDKLSDKDDQTQISSLRDQLSAAAAKPAPKPVVETSGIDVSTGVVFKVQIGAYSQKDLQKYAKGKNFAQESDNGVNKFTIGAFRDYWEADTLKKYLREMGVKDAFIVSYKDGQRVDIKEVLEGVTK